MQDDGSLVWVDLDRCKSCDICVSRCPAGVLAMREDSSYIMGKVIHIVDEKDCIGCRSCEFSCPDFAIFVADEGSNFAKLSNKSKLRAKSIKENGFYLVGAL